MEEIRSFIRSHVETVKLFHDPEETKDVFQRPGEHWTEIGVCPCCGKAVREYPKSYACEAVQGGGCGFVVWKKIAGKEITPAPGKEAHYPWGHRYHQGICEHQDRKEF